MYDKTRQFATISYVQFSAHCVHLAVQDLLYKNKDREMEKEPSLDEDEDEDEPIEDSDRTSLVLNVDVADEILPDLSISFAPAVHSARSCMKFYRNSPMNREILQTAMDNHNKSIKLPVKQISLVMDVKTRWNSLPYMIRSMLDVKPGIIKLKNMRAPPTTDEWAILEDLMAALLPVEVLTTMLCGESVTVLDAESFFLTAFSELERQQTAIGDKMKEILKERYAKRRNKELVSVMQFLATPMTYNHVGHDMLPIGEVREAVKVAYKKLYPDEVDDSNTQEEMDESLVDMPAPMAVEEVAARSCSEQERIAKRFKVDLQNKTMTAEMDSLTFTLDDEITSLINSGNRRPRMTKLQEALKSIPASSTDCERAFSVISRILTKVRNRLEDATLDSLSFAKAYLSRK